MCLVSHGWGSGGVGSPSKKAPRLVSRSPPYMLFLYYSYRGVWETMAGNIVNVTNATENE